MNNIFNNFWDLNENYKIEITDKNDIQLEPELKKIMDMYNIDTFNNGIYDLSELYKNFKEDDYNKSRFENLLEKSFDKKMSINTTKELSTNTFNDYEDLVHHINKYTDKKTRYNIAAKYVQLINATKYMSNGRYINKNPATIESICNDLNILLNKKDIQKIEYEYNNPGENISYKWYIKIWNNIKKYFNKLCRIKN